MKSMELFKQIRQTAHKQLEQIKNEMSLHEDDQIFNKEELYATIDLLKKEKLIYSNDSIVDLICRKVEENTTSESCRNILQRTRIAVDELYSGLISGKALEACNDDSYVIRIGGKMYQSLEIISEYIGSIYMYEYKDCNNPQILLFIIAYNIQRVRCQRQDMEYIDNGCLRQNAEKLLYFRMTEKDAEEYIKITSEVFEVGLAYLVGHELGHHYNKDTSKIKSSEEDKEFEFIIDGTFKENIYALLNKNQRKELKADEYAYQFANDYVLCMYGKHELHQVLGLYSAFLASALLANSEVMTDEHQSIAVRYKYVNILNLGAFSIDNGVLISEKQQHIVDLLNEAGLGYSWCN
ncbi:MAG: hypothetical protein HDT39_16475 [Lachnospiraceae bacterium]|nr:hypothetical protein [Lachnospiraceae bacterium]